MGPDGEMQHFSDDSANITPAETTVKVTMAELLSLLSEARSLVIRGDEIVQGILAPHRDPDDPEVQRVLTAWGGTHFLHHTSDGTHVTLIRRHLPPKPERWWLHLLLAALTLFTTTVAGAYILGRAPLVLRWVDLGPLWLPFPVGLRPRGLPAGLLFSVPLMIILLGHELGHYLMARRRGMNVSPPYFVPAPNWINFIGTFGAFIRLRSVVVNRSVLLDVGAGGPLVSFFLSIPVSLLGLAWSFPFSTPPPHPAAPYLVAFAGQRIWLGDSLLFHLLRAAAAPGETALFLHPLAFAGWLGLFVTALNLVPLAQLDGGHILYALFGRGQRLLGMVFLGALVVLGTWWWGWWFWVVVILLIGRGRIRHPSVFDPVPPVSPARQLVGWTCIVIFILTFIPLPLQV